MRLNLLNLYTKLPKTLLKAWIVLFPLNLGLHFIYKSAYVGGLLIDYLIPTIFVQDLVALCLVVAWLTQRPRLFATKYTLIVLLLLYTVFLSTLLAPRFVPSFYVFLRWVLYAFASIYISQNFDLKKDLKFVSHVFCYWAIFLGILGTAQYLNQGAVFNNYLILGEQPYSSSTPLIDKTNVLNSTKIPAYGLFRHPNIFGGFVSLVLVLINYFYSTKYISKKLFAVSYVLGLLGLFFTFSYFSWASFILGTTLLFAENRSNLRKLLILAILIVVISSFFIGSFTYPRKLAENPSVYKRIELLHAGYKMIVENNILFGAGINQSTLKIEKYTWPIGFIRFVQPTHNAFILLAVEAGIVALLLFLILLAFALQRAYNYRYFLYVLLVQTIFLSCFDHYFLTIHQPFLLLWFILGLVFV